MSDALGNFNSPATAYQIVLKELGKSQNSRDEKIVKVFEILDQVIPNLGVYHEIMKIVRQQLFESVFSNEFTGSVDKNENPSLQRISFYSLYKKLLNARDEQNENLKEQLLEKENELKNKEKELVEHKAIISGIQDELKEAFKKVEQLKAELKNKNMEILNLQEKLEETENSYKQRCSELEERINELTSELEDNRKEINDLLVYKKAYDEIQNTFSSNRDDAKYQKKLMLSNRKNQIAGDILNAKKLEEQILTLINISTEEYDKFIEKQNNYLVDKIKTEINQETPDLETNMNILKHDKTNKMSMFNRYEKNLLKREIEMEKAGFKKSILNLKNEHEMIVQHRLSLEEKLYLLEVDRETSDYMKRQKARANANINSNPSSSLQGLEEHYEPIRKGADKDQFSVQDRIFSKWACTMQTSVNGSIWYDSKLVNFCENCGEKTLICPHKLSLSEAVIEIPEKTKFLKFSRPKLQYNQFMVKRATDAFKKQLARESEYSFGLNASVLTNYAPQFPTETNVNQNPDSIRFLNEGNAEIGMPHNFQRIWYDYSQRTVYKRQVSRPFTYERTISVLQQFLAFLHNRETSKDYNPKDIVESVYDFFEDRYDLEDVKYAAVFDFFTSINFFASRSRLIEIFCHVLIGNLDRGILNYVLYLAEVVDKIEWTETDDVKIFFAIIYPYCDDEDLDNLTLDFTSFGENKVNKKLVMDFIMTLILKKKEFLVNEMEFRLSSQPTMSDYYMTEAEFSEAMEQFFFISDERQISIAYQTALAHCYWDSYISAVPVNKLAHIGAFHCLMQIISELQENINKIIIESRARILENELKLGPVPQKGNQVVEVDDEFIKISDIDDMAMAINNDSD